MESRSGCFPMGALGLLAALIATIGWLVVHRISAEPIAPALIKPLETTSSGDAHGGASYLQSFSKSRVPPARESLSGSS